MANLVDYMLIGGTTILLGGAVVSFIAVCAIRIYLAARFRTLDHDRYVTYAANDAPHDFQIAHAWMYRLTAIGFGLVFAYIAFAALIFSCVGQVSTPP